MSNLSIYLIMFLLFLAHFIYDYVVYILWIKNVFQQESLGLWFLL